MSFDDLKEGLQLKIFIGSIFNCVINFKVGEEMETLSTKEKCFNLCGNKKGYKCEIYINKKIFETLDIRN